MRTLNNLIIIATLLARLANKKFKAAPRAHKLFLAGLCVAILCVNFFAINTPRWEVPQLPGTNSTLNPTLGNSIIPQVRASINNLSLRQVSADTEFQIEIAKIGLSKKVIPNVNPIDEAEYSRVIEDYVAHGEYTRLPDEATIDGNVYLFAHRTGVINGKNVGFFNRLGELQSGDRAQIKFAGKLYTYILKRSFVVSPKDTWVYAERSSAPMLTLQTCENGESQRLILQFTLEKAQ